jgi:hypothetical protein
VLPEGSRQLERPKWRWEDNIKMNLKEQCGKVWAGFILLRIGTVSRIFEHSKRSGFMKGEKFPD